MKPLLDLVAKVGRLKWVILPLLICTMALDFIGTGLVYPLLQLLGEQIPDPGQDKIFDEIRSIFQLLGLPFSRTAIVGLLFIFFFSKAATVVAYRGFAAKGILSYMVSLRSEMFALLYAARFTPEADDNSRLVNGLTAQSELAAGTVYQAFHIVQSILILLGGVVLANIFSWQIFSTILLLVAALFFPLRASMRYAATLGSRLAEMNQKLYKNAEAGVRHRRYLKATQSQDSFFGKISSIANGIRELQFRFTVMNAVTSAVSEPLSLVVVTAMFFAGIYFEVPVELMMIQAIVLYRIFSRTMPLASELQSFRKGYESVRYCEDILGELRAQGQQSSRSMAKMVQLPTAIRFEQVSFGYKEGGLLLRESCMQVPSTGLTVLMGTSGSGKTTALNLFTGLLKPVSGKIMLEETNMAEIDMASYRSRIGLVTQDSPLFGLPLRDNLKLRAKDVSDECVVELLRRFQLEGVFPDRAIDLDYMVTEDVGNLSGGQRQRLALIRELLADPALLLMDEPTSALDERACELIVDMVIELKRKIPVFVSTHDLRFEKIADRLYRIEAGKFIEQEVCSEKAS